MHVTCGFAGAISAGLVAAILVGGALLAPVADWDGLSPSRRRRGPSPTRSSWPSSRPRRTRDPASPAVDDSEPVAIPGEPRRHRRARPLGARRRHAGDAGPAGEGGGAPAPAGDDAEDDPEGLLGRDRRDDGSGGSRIPADRRARGRRLERRRLQGPDLGGLTGWTRATGPQRRRADSDGISNEDELAAAETSPTRAR